MGFIWAHVTLGKWKITQAVIFLVISIGYIAVASYFPQQGPAVAWYKDGVLAETMWALPFSGIREVPFLYRVEEEVCSGNTTLQVNLEFTPIRDKSPEYSLKDVGKILRRFIRAQVQAATSYSEEDIVRLKDRLQILPEDLEGEVSTVVKVTVTF